MILLDEAGCVLPSIAYQPDCCCTVLVMIRKTAWLTSQGARITGADDGEGQCGYQEAAGRAAAAEPEGNH